MVHAKSVLKTGYELAKATGAFASGRDFIQRNVPPGYRDPALRVFKAFEQAAGGAGLYTIYQSLIADDSPGNYAVPPFQRTRYETSASNKARYRRARCRCPRGSRRHQSRYRKRYS